MSFPVHEYRHLIGSRNIIAGLGNAERSLLALSLSLFEESRFLSYLTGLYDTTSKKLRTITGQEAKEATDAVRTSAEKWNESHWTDEQLRLILWITLRESFSLDARLSVSSRGAVAQADDLVAALIHTQDPPGLLKTSRRWLHKQGWLDKDQPALALADIVLPVLDEMLKEGLDAELGKNQAPTEQDRRQQLGEYIKTLANFDTQDQQKHLQQTGAHQANQAALRNMALVGGSLGVFGSAVGSAGFSAYILAAQASSYIPFISGPGLVSFVNVLANPLTMLGGSGLAVWFFGSKVASQVRCNVATRVIALLVIRGLAAGHQGTQSALQAFSTAPTLTGGTGLPSKVLSAYSVDWQRIHHIIGRELETLPEDTLRLMDQPYAPAAHTELDNARAMAALTVGDIIYTTALINPAVVEATDFARVADLAGNFAFAEYAQQLMSRSPEVVTGAVSNIKGYLAEYLAAAHLSAAGHVVSMPEASNTAGWDLLVDGQPFQVKFHADLQGIREHFSHYDYPIIANTELQGQIPDEWADKVMFIDGLDNQLVTEITENTLSAAADLADPGLPAGALLISVWRGIQEWQAGQVNHRQLFGLVMLDGSVRFGLALTGKVAGASVGLLLFGPAGAWVLGAGLPILAQGQTAKAKNLLNKYRQTPAVRDWTKQAHDAMDELQKKLNELLKSRRHQLADKYRLLGTDQLSQYLRWQVADQSRFTRECVQQLDSLQEKNYPVPEARMAAFGQWLASADLYPGGYQPQLRCVAEALSSRPGIINDTDMSLLREQAEGWKEKTGSFLGRAREAIGEKASEQKESLIDKLYELEKRSRKLRKNPYRDS